MNSSYGVGVGKKIFRSLQLRHGDWIHMPDIGWRQINESSSKRVLESRGIELPLGATGDGADVQSVHALGNLKDRYPDTREQCSPGSAEAMVRRRPKRLT